MYFDELSGENTCVRRRAKTIPGNNERKVKLCVPWSFAEWQKQCQDKDSNEILYSVHEETINYYLSAILKSQLGSQDFQTTFVQYQYLLQALQVETLQVQYFPPCVDILLPIFIFHVFVSHLMNIDAENLLTEWGKARFETFLCQAGSSGKYAFGGCFKSNKFGPSVMHKSYLKNQYCRKMFYDIVIMRQMNSWPSAWENIGCVERHRIRYLDLFLKTSAYQVTMPRNLISDFCNK